jgi:hypothetical protein
MPAFIVSLQSDMIRVQAECRSVNFYNIDTITESKREIVLYLAQMPGEDNAERILQDLNDILGDPPNCSLRRNYINSLALKQSPALTLGPIASRMRSLLEPAVVMPGLLDVLHSDEEKVIPKKGASLADSLWNTKQIDKLRLRFLLAVWASVCL